MIAQAILSSQPTVIREVPVPPTAQLVIAAATTQAVIATEQAVIATAKAAESAASAASIFIPTINTQTGTSYTLQTADNDGKTIVRMNNAASNTCTIPSTQTKTVTVRQVGAGVTTLVAGSGVTLNGNLVFSGANDAKSIVPVSAGVYDVYGAQ